MRSDRPEALQFRLLNALALPGGGNSGNFVPVVIIPSTDCRGTDTEWMRRLALDFAYPVTAYLVPHSTMHETEQNEILEYGLRYFAADVEIPVCGHATFASATVVFSLHPSALAIQFRTLGGSLTTVRKPGGAEMSLPIIPLDRYTPEDQSRLTRHAVDCLEACSSVKATDLMNVSTFQFASRTNYLIELKKEVDLTGVQIDSKAIISLTTGLMILTRMVSSEAGCNTLPINSRVFAPGLGVEEDTVSGVPHAVMTGYYLSPPVLERLPFLLRGIKPEDITILGRQLSPRGGGMTCKLDGNLAKIEGHNVEWARGTLERPLQSASYL